MARRAAALTLGLAVVVTIGLGLLISILAKNDFAWAAKNRDRILAEWNKRYDAKSEKR